MRFTRRFNSGLRPPVLIAVKRSRTYQLLYNYAAASSGARRAKVRRLNLRAATSKRLQCLYCLVTNDVLANDTLVLNDALVVNNALAVNNA
jgi:hypothetical protein